MGISGIEFKKKNRIDIINTFANTDNVSKRHHPTGNSKTIIQSNTFSELI